jgi:uncharacterized protein YecE (DUF72 family)
MSSHQQVNSTVRIGCSGWQYKQWRGGFYPAGLPTSRWFDHYARHFDTVEVNNTFYRLPEAATFAAWARRAPRGFVFSVKASRFLTHMKKLKDPEEPLARFFTRASRLRRTLGPVLYQLPPRWPVNEDRLRGFLQAAVHASRSSRVSSSARHVVEFRDPSWYRSAVFELLTAHRAALCLHDMPGSTPERLEVGPFVYVRFHGTTRYGGRYDDKTLHEWAEWLAERAARGTPVYAYFNNDVGGHAPRDAVRLRNAIARRL